MSVLNLAAEAVGFAPLRGKLGSGPRRSGTGRSKSQGGCSGRARFAAWTFNRAGA
jgi:hypothetical protein